MATYYVRPTNGTDGAAGTSFATAWKTTQWALDHCTAGDTIYLCAEAVEQTSSQIDIDTNTGTINFYIRLEGRDGVDGTTPAQYTIQRTGSAGNFIVADTAAVEYFHFNRITFDGNGIATNCVKSTVNNAIIGYQWVDCIFKNATSDGLIFANTSVNNPWTFVNCEFFNNGGYGYAGSTSFGTGILTNCKIYNNAVGGAYMCDSTILANCFFYGNTGDGLITDANGSDGSCYFNSVFYNNTANGISIETTSVENWACVGCSFVNNGGYGLWKTSISETNSIENNHYYNNTSGHTTLVSDANINNGTVGYLNITGNPLFTDPNNGDFTPLPGSPLVQAGYNNTTIGPMGTKLRTVVSSI